MAGNFQPSPRKKNALDNRKLSLSAPVPGVQGKFARLDWGLYTNNPRITVYTNDPNDEQNERGKISANLDTPAMFAFLHQFNQVIEGAPGQKFKVENKNFTFYGGKRSDRPEVLSELWCGKDEDGTIWISVVDAKKRDRPKIKFKFGTSDWHHFVKGDGTPFSPAEMSAAFAKGYWKILSEMLPHLQVTEYKEPEPRPEGGYNRGGQGGGGQRGNYGGGGGGYNRGGNQGSGSDDSSGGDEIPF